MAHAAAEVDDAPALDRSEQAQLGLAGEVGAVDDVDGRARRSSAVV